jgi:adenylate cyclase
MPILISLVSSGVAFLLSIGIPAEIPFLKTAQLKTLDERFAHRGTIDIKDSSKVVIVSITKESFEGLPNSFPFPRRYYAHVIKNIFDAGAKTVGVDIVFDQPSRIPGDDSLFSETLKKYKNVVLAGHSDIDVSGRYKIFKSRDFYNNFFMKEDSAIGIVFVGNDIDGIYRRYMPFNEFQIGPDKYKVMPSFAFAVLANYLGLGNSTAIDSDSCFRLGGITIPKYDKVSMLINYPGPAGSFPTYDIYQVIDDSSFKTKDEREFGIDINSYYDLKEKGVFKNKIVLIGAEYPESGDLKPIPFAVNGGIHGGNNAYGVEIHAAAIETVLDRNFLTHSSRLFDFIEMFVGAFLIALTSFSFRSMLHSKSILAILVPFLVTAVVIIVSYEAGLVFFDKNRLILNIVYPIVAYTFSYVGTVVYQYVSERKQKSIIKSIFSRYVDPSIVNKLVDHPELVKLGGERKTLTVLFSDITNFTGISEDLSPEQLIEHLNGYFAVMTDIVFKHGGTLDKYIGDAIIAFWGAPIDLQDHAYRACRCGVEMARRLNDLHGIWKSEGKPIFNFRIGINTGEVIVGNVGGNERFDYTVIGDSVNLAARLEAANKMYKTQILMSEYTYGFVKEKVFARELDLIVVKGKTKPVRIYELISDDIDSVPFEKKLLVETYGKGIEKYRNREWRKAAGYFQKCLAIDPSDYPSEMYLERSRTFERRPPSPYWDGVFVMETK